MRPYIYKMINKINIDVKIYVDKLMEGINQMSLVESLVEEWGIRNEVAFKDLLAENITLQSSVNFEENGDPVLGEKQFEEVLVKTATEQVVEEMVEEGVLVKGLEEGNTESTYTIKLIPDGEEGDDK